MLLAQSFAKLISSWDNGELAALDEDIISGQIILVLFRSLLRVLTTQNKDGSWGFRGPQEETAYALLALVELAGLPMSSYIKEHIGAAVSRGRDYLQARRHGAKAEYLWVEKVLYSSEYISQAYILAALKAPIAEPRAGDRLKSISAIDDHRMTKSIEILHSLPLLASQPRWLIVASWIEGQLLLPAISDLRQAEHKRIGTTKDKYFGWIPVIWALANNVNGCSIPGKLLSTMLRVSVLNFQIDEFMENVVERDYGDDIISLQAVIDACFTTGGLQTVADSLRAAQAGPTESPSPNHNNTITDQDQIPHSTRHSVISQNFQSFVNNITNLARDVGVQSSSMERIQAELKAFLHAHLAQARLNRKFSQLKQTCSSSLLMETFHQKLKISFQTWLGTAAVHTSCPYSFELYLGLASAMYGAPLLESFGQLYIAQDLCGHLARMCRLYNDLGSLKRDIAEGNLNCVNFPELWHGPGSLKAPDPVEESIGEDKSDNVMNDYERPKQMLMELAGWERKGLERAFEGLSRVPETPKRLMSAVKVFVDVTDLFGQIYVVKDLASKKI